VTGVPVRGHSTTRLGAAVVILAAWTGAAFLSMAVVAPAAFAVLPSRTLAGAMVGRVLDPLFLAGILMAFVVAALARGVRRASLASLLTVVACAWAQFVIDPRIAQLREAIGGPVDALAADDARRVAFGRLHGYSVGGLGIAMLAAITALVFILKALRTGPRTA
jgi:hypothetical protein